MSIAGFSIHKELAFGSDAVLSNYEMLKTATVNASQTFSMMNQLGIIEKGKMANLLLMEETPILFV
ncbi:MAG: amidohydrolase family protein [Saprospiraceae bacterium]|nr:amidohydrolase family protein [Saprospiraceae bacterium]